MDNQPTSVLDDTALDRTDAGRYDRALDETPMPHKWGSARSIQIEKWQHGRGRSSTFPSKDRALAWEARSASNRENVSVEDENSRQELLERPPLRNTGEVCEVAELFDESDLIFDNEGAAEMDSDGASSADDYPLSCVQLTPTPDSVDLIDATEVNIDDAVRPSSAPSWARRTVRDAFATDINFSWHRVTVQVPEQPKKKVPAKTILNNIHGLARAGSLLAIMGASGAGKTTFLNLLTDRTASGLQVNAVLAINDNAIKPSDVRRISSYVQQQDLFFSNLTVLEHLTVQALLRMNRNLTRKARLARVHEVLHELGLMDVINSYIGSVSGGTRGISGGQQKRLSFATEVLTDPPVLFADEPTTGLDSFASEIVVHHLKRMAKSGRTILCTIHQPPTEVFNCFDDLLLLAEGRTAYLGPRAAAVSYFSNIGYSCPSGFNPADFYIYTLAVVPTEREESLAKIEEITDKYLEVEKNEGVHDRPLPKPSAALTRTVQELADEQGESVLNQLAVLGKRTFRLTMRSMVMVQLNIMATLVVAIAMGLFYLDIGTEENIVRRVQGITGAIFLLISVGGYNGAGNIAQVVPVEHPIFVREYESGTYSPAVYFICKYLATVPLVLVLQLVASVITYFMFGLVREAGRYFIFYAVNVMVLLCAESIGYIISAVAGSNLSVAFALTPVGIVPLMLFSGLLLNLNSTPDYVVWLEALSFMRWGFEAAMINEFQQDFLQNCTVLNATEACFSNGDQVLQHFGFDTSTDTIGRNFGIMAALAIGYRLVAFIITMISLRMGVKR